MIRNANLTTVLANNSAKRKNDTNPGNQDDSKENTSYLLEAGAYIASRGGIAFTLVSGEQISTADIRSMVKILKSQASQKRTWQSRPSQDKVADNSNSRSYFRSNKPLIGPKPGVKEMTAPVIPKVYPQGEVKASGDQRVQWEPDNHTNFFQPPNDKDYTSAELT